MMRFFRKTSRHARVRSVRRTTPLRLDQLEARLLLSTFTVDNTADEGTGSLRQAILEANANLGADTIQFAPAVSGTITLTSGELTITDPLDIQGPGRFVLAVSGNSASRIFRVTTSATISGLMIREGSASNGGGIINDGTLTVSDSSFSFNTASSRGGGIYNNGGTLTVSNSRVDGNYASDGGGIYNNGGTLTVSNSSVSGNYASFRFGSGGGIFNNGGTLTLSNSGVNGNMASLYGGGIANFGTLTVNNSSILTNTVAIYEIYGDIIGGGGIANFGSLTVSNSNLETNTAREGSGDEIFGGGILNFGTLTVSSSSFWSNWATHTAGSSAGGGIANLGEATVSDSTFTTNLTNNIENLGTLTVSGTLVNFGSVENLGTLTVSNSTLVGSSISNTVVGTMTVRNSTLVNSPISNSGGATVSSSTLSNSGIDNIGFVTLNNSIVTATSSGVSISSSGVLTGSHNLIEDGTGSDGLTGTITGDPKLGRLDLYGGPTSTYDLLAGSPAIDAGDDTLAADLVTDQRGVPHARINGAHVDIGAYETPGPTISGTGDDDIITIGPGTQPTTIKVTVNGAVYDNQDGLVIDGLGGSDTYLVTLASGTRTVAIDDTGSTGSDTLTVTGTAGVDSIFKNDTWVTLGVPVQQAVLKRGIESCTIHGGAGNDTITDPGSDTQIYGDEGNDTIVVNATGGSGVFVDGGAGSDTYIIGGGLLGGPVTVADSGESGTDSISIVGTSGDDSIFQTAGGFRLNGTAVTASGLEAASVDGGGSAGDTFTVEGSPLLPTNVQGVSSAAVTGTGGSDVIRINATSNAGEVKVRVNGALVGTYRPTGQLTVNGLAGDDDIQVDGAVTLPVWLDGGDGNDQLMGGGGDDVLTDLSGNNQIHAGSGNDVVVVGDGDNQIWTDGGDDSITAGGGNNTIHAGKGANAILVGGGNNSIWTSGGVDSITAGDGANQIHLGGDSDTLVVGNGDNRIWGEGGADVITAGDGNNVIVAGSGNDAISVGNGNNTISAGSGNDLIITGDGNNNVDGGAGDDDVKTGAGNDVIDGGSGDDVILAGNGDDTITGGSGNDFLIGGTGKDRIVGSSGADILVAGDIDSSFDMASLRAISQEWATLHSASEAEAVDAALDETIGDTNSDQLTGGSGADLFIINLGDVITDFQFGKPKSNKEGDVVIRDGVVIA